MHKAATIGFGAFGHAIDCTIPMQAQNQIALRRLLARSFEKMSITSGVYVPAINPNIAEWSSLRIN
jgi:hypothetical protein